MKYQEYFKKEREGNKTWKEEGKLKSVNDLSIREQIQVRRAWTARPQDVPEKTQRDKMDNKGSISFQRVRRLSVQLMISLKTLSESGALSHMSPILALLKTQKRVCFLLTNIQLNYTSKTCCILFNPVPIYLLHMLFSHLHQLPWT